MKLRKNILVLLTMLVMVFGSTATVFAAEPGSNSTIAEYVEAGDVKIGGIVLAPNLNAYDNTYSYYQGKDSSGNVAYYVVQKEQEEAVADKINNKAGGQEVVSNLNDSMFGGFNIGANTTSAMSLLSGFVAPITTLLGIIVVIVTVGMTVFTSLDLCYIAFPVFRDKCETQKMNGGFGTKQGKDGNNKLSFITDDAQYAVKAADTTESGKSPFLIYLKSRALSFVLLAIVIFILLTGNISIFATLALKLVQGILDFLNGFK